MERRAILKVVLVGLLVVSFVLPVQASAQSRSRRGGLYGDWQIKMKFRRAGVRVDPGVFQEPGGLHRPMDQLLGNE